MEIPHPNLLGISLCIFVVGLHLMIQYEVINDTRQDTFHEGVHHESRCICKCPKDPQTNREIYIESPAKEGTCKCERLVLPKRPDAITPKDKDILCDLCECTFEVRNLLKQKVAVIIVLAVICGVILYSICIGCIYGCILPVLEKRAAFNRTR